MGTLEREEIIKQLEVRYRSITRKITKTSKGRTISHMGLYKTSFGKRLGKNIDHIRNFALKGTLVVFPFDIFIQNLRQIYSDPQYQDTLRKSDVSKTDLDLINLIQKQLVTSLSTSSSNELFSKEDERIFMGTLVTSLYALVDGYTIDALQQVIEVDNAPKRIIRNFGTPLHFSFQDVEEILCSPDDKLRSIALDMTRKRSIRNRLRLIKSGTGIWDCIDKVMKKLSLTKYEQCFEEFIELRQKIAHQYPIPKPEKFLRNAIIGDFVDQLRTRFRESMEDIQMPPEYLSDFFEFFMKWLDNRQTSLGIILQLTTMAAVYPALIDNAFDIL